MIMLKYIFGGIGLTSITLSLQPFYTKIQPYWAYFFIIGIILFFIPVFQWLFKNGGLKLFKIKWLAGNNLILKDDFATDKGWQQYGNGSIEIKQGISKSHGRALKKDKNADPHGGYLPIGKAIKNGFCFSGWIYSPKERGQNAWGDRLAIEGDNFDGYGFAVAQSLGWVEIERRDGGDEAVCISERIIFSPPKESWYRFEFIRLENGEMFLCLYDLSGAKLAQVFANDKKYNSFDKVAVHGGYPYYVDKLQIKNT